MGSFRLASGNWFKNNSNKRGKGKKKRLSKGKKNFYPHPYYIMTIKKTENQMKSNKFRLNFYGHKQPEVIAKI